MRQETEPPCRRAALCAAYQRFVAMRITQCKRPRVVAPPALRSGCAAGSCNADAHEIPRYGFARIPLIHQRFSGSASLFPPPHMPHDSPVCPPPPSPPPPPATCVPAGRPGPSRRSAPPGCPRCRRAAGTASPPPPPPPSEPPHPLSPSIQHSAPPPPPPTRVPALRARAHDSCPRRRAVPALRPTLRAAGGGRGAAPSRPPHSHARTARHHASESACRVGGGGGTCSLRLPRSRCASTSARARSSASCTGPRPATRATGTPHFAAIQYEYPPPPPLLRVSCAHCPLVSASWIRRCWPESQPSQAAFSAVRFPPGRKGRCPRRQQRPSLRPPRRRPSQTTPSTASHRAHEQHPADLRPRTDTRGGPETYSGTTRLGATRAGTAPSPWPRSADAGRRAGESHRRRARPRCPRDGLRQCRGCAGCRGETGAVTGT